MSYYTFKPSLMARPLVTCNKVRVDNVLMCRLIYKQSCSYYWRRLHVQINLFHIKYPTPRTCGAYDITLISGSRDQVLHVFETTWEIIDHFFLSFFVFRQQIIIEAGTSVFYFVFIVQN